MNDNEIRNNCVASWWKCRVGLDRPITARLAVDLITKDRGGSDDVEGINFIFDTPESPASRLGCWLRANIKTPITIDGATYLFDKTSRKGKPAKWTLFQHAFR